MIDLQLSAIEQLRVKSPDKFVYEQPVTPQNLINDVMSHIRVDSSASILVLFTVEWALYLRKIGFVDVTVAADNDPIIANACLVFGLKYQDISNVEKNNMNFDVVVGNPPYNSSSGGPHGTAGNNVLYRSFADLAERLSKRYIGFVCPKGVIKYLHKKNMVPVYVNLMDSSTWKFDTCYYIRDKLVSTPKCVYDAPDAIVRKMFSDSDLFNCVLVDGKSNPMPKRASGLPIIHGIVDHKSTKTPSFMYGQIDSSVAVFGPKFISNLYGRKASWAVTDNPTCVPGFTFKFDTIDEASRFYTFLENNKALEYFRQRMNEHKGVVKVTRYLKKFDLTQIVTGFEYPAEWNLTQDEINLIEATVK